MPSKGTSDSHDKSKQPASWRGQHVLDVAYPSTPARPSVPCPRPANQGSHAHGTWTSPPEEPYHCEANRKLGQQALRADSSEPSSSDRRVARSSSQAPGVVQGFEPDYPGGIGAAGGRRNAICSEAIKEYLATHPHNEAWGTDEDEDDDFVIVQKQFPPPTTAGQRTGTAATQRSSSSTTERGTASSTATTRALRGTVNASAADDETVQVGTFWNNQGARQRGRYG